MVFVVFVAVAFAIADFAILSVVLNETGCFSTPNCVLRYFNTTSSCTETPEYISCDTNGRVTALNFNRNNTPARLNGTLPVMLCAKRCSKL